MNSPSTAVDPLFELRTDAHYAMYHANRALVARDWSDPAYVSGRASLDAVLADFWAAKWRLGRYEGTYSAHASNDKSAAMRESAGAGFNRVIEAANAITAALRAGKDSPSFDAPTRTAGHEVRFREDVPLVPAICPVVVLQGSHRDMGRQYAKQVIDIYGPWIFAQTANRRFSDAEAREIPRWETELRTHMPEMLDFARGWADGATAAGLAMSYEQVLSIFTGTRPPADAPRPLGFAFADGNGDATTQAYFGVGNLDAAKKGEPVPDDMCSGICAWGDATADGILVAGSSSDHDCTYQATIVAFPDNGHAFIYTPFSANGSIPVLGNIFMGGHPGFNSAGLAYVHHGGANTGEPKEQWGYGVRRGPTTFHLLMNAGSASEARDWQLQWPVGDTAISLGSAGGLYADDNYGVTVESRSGCPTNPDPVLRELCYDAFGKPYSFLYANNNAIDPRSSRANGAPKAGYKYSLAGGWHTFDPQVIFSEAGGPALRRLMTKNSECRNRYAYRTMLAGYGRIDLDYMTATYRCSGTLPEGSFEDVCARWHAGEQWDCSVAHRTNAFVAVIQPNATGGGIYRGCIGPANRAVQVRDAGHGYHYHDETNAFSELRLKSSPEAVLEAALDTAGEQAGIAESLLGGLSRDHAGRTALSSLLRTAQGELADARRRVAAKFRGDRDTQLAGISAAVRAATRAQVRAAQVIEAIRPPADDPARLNK